MIQKFRMLSHLTRCLLFFGLSAVLLLVFLLGILTGGSKTDQKQPFFNDVSAIASDGESVYTLDNMFHTVCKYQEDGTFVWSMRFSSSGDSALFIDKDGNLCRYDLQTRTTHRYDETGRELGSAWDPDHHAALKQVRTGSKTYTLKDNLMLPSTVSVESGDETHTIRVENGFGKLVFSLLCVIFVGGLVLACYHLLKHKAARKTAS